MENIYVGFWAALIIYTLYLLIIILNKRRLNNYVNNSKECTLIKRRFKINFDKVNHKLVANLFAIDNALIIGFTFAVILYIDNLILKLLAAFLIFTVLVIITYLMIGKFIKGKEAK